MMTSTLYKKRYTIATKVAFVAIWLIIWQIVALLVANAIILVSPITVVHTLGQLAVTSDFWMSIWGTFSKVVYGFLLAVVIGVAFAVLAYRLRLFRDFFAPLMSALRAVPVASFIIILLIALRSRIYLSLIIALIMALPIIYANMLAGLNAISKQMLDMAKVYNLNLGRRIIYIYGYHTMPNFVTSCKVGIGLAFKASVAAELIGLVQHTIGNELYFARLWLIMDKVFAWTVVIVVVSALFELMVVSLAKLVQRRIER